MQNICESEKREDSIENMSVYVCKECVCLCEREDQMKLMRLESEKMKNQA